MDNKKLIVKDILKGLKPISSTLSEMALESWQTGGEDSESFLPSDVLDLMFPFENAFTKFERSMDRVNYPYDLVTGEMTEGSTIVRVELERHSRQKDTWMLTIIAMSDIISNFKATSLYDQIYDSESPRTVKQIEKIFDTFLQDVDKLYQTRFPSKQENILKNIEKAIKRKYDVGYITSSSNCFVDDYAQLSFGYEITFEFSL